MDKEMVLWELMEIKDQVQIMSLIVLSHSLYVQILLQVNLKFLDWLADINQLILIVISLNQEFYLERF